MSKGKQWLVPELELAPRGTPPASHGPTLLPLMKLEKGGEEWKCHQKRPHFGLHSLTSKKTLEHLICI